MLFAVGSGKMMAIWPMFTQTKSSAGKQSAASTASRSSNKINDESVSQAINNSPASSESTTNFALDSTVGINTLRQSRGSQSRQDDLVKSTLQDVSNSRLSRSDVTAMSEQMNSTGITIDSRNFEGRAQNSTLMGNKATWLNLPQAAMRSMYKSLQNMQPREFATNFMTRLFRTNKIDPTRLSSGKQAEVAALEAKGAETVKTVSNLGQFKNWADEMMTKLTNIVKAKSKKQDQNDEPENNQEIEIIEMTVPGTNSEGLPHGYKQSTQTAGIRFATAELPIAHASSLSNAP